CYARGDCARLEGKGRNFRAGAALLVKAFPIIAITEPERIFFFQKRRTVFLARSSIFIRAARPQRGRAFRAGFFLKRGPSGSLRGMGVRKRYEIRSTRLV